MRGWEEETSPRFRQLLMYPAPSPTHHLATTSNVTPRESTHTLRTNVARTSHPPSRRGHKRGDLNRQACAVPTHPNQNISQVRRTSEVSPILRLHARPIDSTTATATARFEVSHDPPYPASTTCGLFRLSQCRSLSKSEISHARHCVSVPSSRSSETAAGRECGAVCQDSRVAPARNEAQNAPARLYASRLYASYTGLTAEITDLLAALGPLFRHAVPYLSESAVQTTARLARLCLPASSVSPSSSFPSIRLPKKVATIGAVL